MSLMLRKKCQPLLDSAGLANYHIEINDYKNVDVTGPCGKTFFTISGITFTRTNPSNAEIDFAAELLDNFLDAHIVHITKVLKAATVLQNTPEPVPSSDTIFFDVKNEKIIKTYQSQYDEYRRERSFKVFWNKEGKFFISVKGHSSEFELFEEFIEDLNNNKKLYKTLKKEFIVHQKYADLKKQYETALSELRTCNI